MRDISDLVSPRQAARALGVSESSLKRWCDQGLIRMTRTAGGHRKLPIAEVLRYVRDHNCPLRHPDLLGLPAASPRAAIGLGRAVPLLVDSLLAGDDVVARQLVVDLYAAGHPLSVLFDEVIAEAFRQIGDRWECGTAEVYQERRGCQIALRTLYDLRRMQTPPPETGRIAAGGAIEGDPYSLPTTMAELVLREGGWRATSLGSSLPVDSLIRFIREVRPVLFWISVSHLENPERFLERFALLSQTCTEAGTALVAGGRVLTEPLRQRMCYAAYGDTMQHLEAFARTLAGPTGGTATTGPGTTGPAAEPPGDA